MIYVYDLKYMDKDLDNYMPPKIIGVVLCDTMWWSQCGLTVYLVYLPVEV